MDESYDSYATSLIIGTIFVCIVIIPTILYSVRNATKEVRIIISASAIFAVITSVVLIGTVLEWDTSTIIVLSFLVFVVFSAIIYGILHHGHEENENNIQNENSDIEYLVNYAPTQQKKLKAKYCTLCGYPLIETDKYCGQCGYEISK